MEILKLKNYEIEVPGMGVKLDRFNFALSRGDICSVSADFPDAAMVFLKSIVTLITPTSGAFMFNEKSYDLTNYKTLLPCKRQIGYISSETALVSNRTIRENLMLKRYYYENRLDIDLNKWALELCEIFNMTDKLDIKPIYLSSMDNYFAVAIRELVNSPKILVLDRPEDFIAHTKFDSFIDIIKDVIQHGLPIVFYSNWEEINDTFPNKRVSIKGSKLTLDNNLEKHYDV